MQNFTPAVTCILATVFYLTSCGFDCVEKKTGMHKSSQTIKEAKENEVFQFEFTLDRSIFPLDSEFVFKIKNAWVENNWKYECIDNKPKVIRDSSYQFVIDAEYVGEAINSDYWLENNHLGAVLNYAYSGQDTFMLSLYKDTSYTLSQNKIVTATIAFVKQKVSR